MFPMPFNVIFLVLVSVMVSWQTACETKHTVKQIFSYSCAESLVYMSNQFYWWRGSQGRPQLFPTNRISTVRLQSLYHSVAIDLSTCFQTQLIKMVRVGVVGYGALGR